MTNTSTIHPHALKLSRIYAARLVQRRAIHPNELQDVASELMLHFVSVQDKYNEERGEPEAFIERVFRNATISIVRKRRAWKRKAKIRSIETLPHAVARLPGIDDSWTADVDLRVDLEALIPLLTESQRETVELLKQHDTTSTAKLRGVSRRTLRDEIQRIAAVFRDHGMDLYLRPSTPRRSPNA